MWAFGVPNIGFAVEGATVLRYPSSLSRALCLHTVERNLAVVTALHFTNQLKQDPNPVTTLGTISTLILLCTIYIPLFLAASAFYTIEFFIQTVLPIVTLGRVSHTSLHRAFAQPYEFIDKSGLFVMQHVETEVIGKISSALYESCSNERHWKGFWPIFHINLDSSEERELEAGLEPFVQAISETTGMECTILKAGSSFVRIGGRCFRSRISIAEAIGANVDMAHRKISCVLGRMYDAHNIFYKVNRVSLSDRPIPAQIQAFSDGEKFAKLVYRTQDYVSPFRELAEQIQDYPLTLDIARSNEIDVVRSNIVLLKHLIGITITLIGGAWYGLHSIFVEKNIDKSAYLLALYALWVNLAFVPVLGKDVLSFQDVVRVKRRRVIEAVLHNQSKIGTISGHDWNYRCSTGSVDLGALTSEEAALTARFCPQAEYLWALDLCSLRSYKAPATVTHNMLYPKKWEVQRAIVKLEGESKRVGFGS